MMHRDFFGDRCCTLDVQQRGHAGPGLVWRAAICRFDGTRGKGGLTPAACSCTTSRTRPTRTRDFRRVLLRPRLDWRAHCKGQRR